MSRYRKGDIVADRWNNVLMVDYASGADSFYYLLDQRKGLCCREERYLRPASPGERMAFLVKREFD